MPEELYCDKKCGFGCTRAAYDQAFKEANELASRMGEGWEIKLWENWGWNYKVTKGVVTIHVSTGGSTVKSGWKVQSYSAWIEPGVIGNASVQFIESGKSPEEALEIAMRRARDFIAKLTSDLENIKEGK